MLEPEKNSVQMVSGSCGSLFLTQDKKHLTIQTFFSQLYVSQFSFFFLGVRIARYKVLSVREILNCGGKQL